MVRKSNTKPHIHFLGIGGSGASAAAAIAQAHGYQISGCDKHPQTEFTRVFDKKVLFKGHSPSHLTGGNKVDLLAVTPAIFSLDPDNPELLEAKKRRVPILTWQEFMGKYLEKDKLVVAVCGTHGKSTTTAMIGLLLEDAGLNPTVELGAIIPRWGTNHRIGKSKYFVTEADEFNDNFLSTHPDISVVTTIEMDHPEYFKDFKAVKKSFGKFLRQTKKTVVANLKDNGVKAVLSRGVKLPHTGGVQIVDYSKQPIGFPLKVAGEHNKWNASAAYLVGLVLGIKPKIIRKSLQKYTGIGRRFELLGEVKRCQIYSDFAHHPTEIKVTLEAARQKFPQQKIIVLFQPHMFSRTKALFNDFVKVFQELPVDKIYILDIYPSREIDTGLVNSKQLWEAINNPHTSYLPDFNHLQEELVGKLGKDTVVFFVGAGSIDQMAREFVKDYE